MNFETNKRGGWIIPDNTVLPPKISIPDHSVIGSNVEFAENKSKVVQSPIGPYVQYENNTTFGNFIEFKPYTNFGDGHKFGNDNKFGHSCLFGNDNSFGIACIFDRYNTFGNNNKFKCYTIFSNNTKFGDGTRFQYSVEFGNSTTFGLKTSIDNNHRTNILTLSNVDNDGQQIIITYGDNGVIIYVNWVRGSAYPGPFIGTVEEFVKRAKSSNNHVSATVIPAIVESLKNLKGIDNDNQSTTI